MNNKFFFLYQDCQIVKGSKNILLCDLHTKNVINANSIFSYFENDNSILYEDKNKEVIDFLVAEKFGYISDEKNENKKELRWESSKIINEVIIEHSKSEGFSLENVYKKIETIGAEFIQIRFIDYSFTKLKKVLSLLSASSIRTIEILVPYMEEKKNSTLINFLEKNPRVQILYFYNAPFNQSINKPFYFNVVYYEKNLIDEKLCGIVNTDYFLIDIKNFSKAKNVNSCLKDKLFISHNGTIKNCPSLNYEIGHINDILLEDLFMEIEGDLIRSVTKDSINVCKDCEYRYMCIDCRAYIEEPSNIFSKPLKCGYDPYKGIWSDWTKNPLKQIAIKYYEIEIN
ncbi:grasp-with-spasm system SPASM domain peptide maturase [Elizabethkingia miricola]|uniref:grasp-with-spasm system SPASM domain peptide maturase n=1 Tax=Elizabethkingia miricola TaxID=172045 RepID=UPI000999A1C5|nr:grasp-with-spasm system SPASM domain peptide maturase [Elizabethkingia miricola]OPC29915.1 grasp-with-spasm system SPASM domain peptide maturase [Elizabethkingia miricola]